MGFVAITAAFAGVLQIPTKEEEALNGSIILLHPPQTGLSMSGQKIKI
jgi:hypothetical protein